MKLIIDIPEDWEKGIKNMYDWDIANFLYETCRNGTPIPDNATNGEVLKTMFKPNRITRTDDVVREEYEFDEAWWNAPYKAESEEQTE